MTALDAGFRLQLFVAAFGAHDETVKGNNIDGRLPIYGPIHSLLLIKDAVLLNPDPTPRVLNGIRILPCTPQNHASLQDNGRLPDDLSAHSGRHTQSGHPLYEMFPAFYQAKENDTIFFYHLSQPFFGRSKRIDKGEKDCLINGDKP